MSNDMEAKFREGFILFSSCEDKMDPRKFVELMNSFGIILPNEELSDLPDVITMDFWLQFANEHFNFKEPFKALIDVNNNANLQIDTKNFIGIMKALDSKLTEADYGLLMQIANPENDKYIDLKSLPNKLAANM